MPTTPRLKASLHAQAAGLTQRVYEPMVSGRLSLQNSAWFCGFFYLDPVRVGPVFRLHLFWSCCPAINRANPDRLVTPLPGRLNSFFTFFIRANQSSVSSASKQGLSQREVVCPMGARTFSIRIVQVERDASTSIKNMIATIMASPCHMLVSQASAQNGRSFESVRFYVLI
jgi:hypothetical protein